MYRHSHLPLYLYSLESKIYFIFTLYMAVMAWLLWIFVFSSGGSYRRSSPYLASAILMITSGSKILSWATQLHLKPMLRSSVCFVIFYWLKWDIWPTQWLGGVPPVRQPESRAHEQDCIILSYRQENENMEITSQRCLIHLIAAVVILCLVNREFHFPFWTLGEVQRRLHFPLVMS